MTHEKYNELQKKMDKLVSDFVDEELFQKIITLMDIYK